MHETLGSIFSTKKKRTKKLWIQESYRITQTNFLGLHIREVVLEGQRLALSYRKSKIHLD
jgi:hypothetical protein